LAESDFKFSVGADTSAAQKGLDELISLLEKNSNQKIRLSLDLSQIEMPKEGISQQFRDAMLKDFADLGSRAGEIMYETIGSSLYNNLSTQIEQSFKGISTTGLNLQGQMDVIPNDSGQQKAIVANMRARYEEEDRLAKASEETARKSADFKKQQAEDEAKYKEILLQRTLESENNASKQREEYNRNDARSQYESMRARFAAQDREAALLQEQVNAYPRLRYALYDVAASLNVVSNATGGFAAASVKAYADFESAFTSVQRTTSGTSSEIATLRQQLLDLSTTIPVSFKEITAIATLGGQLGVASQDIAEFTDTVSKFAATTNVNAESAAQSFGALGELLNISATEYDKLGSAIAYAGINAVATESEILSVSTAIAGVAANAGLSAEYVIGLSTSLASLRVPAEQSRGALTRIFQEISRSALQGGSAMDEFARLVGMTKEQATQLATTDIQTFFDKFLVGLSSMDTAGLTQSLDRLNLSDIRVTNTLARLSGNLDLVKTNMDNVNESYANGTFLTEAFGNVADDFNSKVEILNNTFMELQAAIGQGLGEALKGPIDLITSFAKALTKIAETGPGQAILTVTTALLGLTGALTTALGVFALFAASSLAFRTAVIEAGNQSAIAGSKVFILADRISKIPFATGGAIAGLKAFSAEVATAAFTMNNLSKAGSVLMKGFGWTALLSIGLELLSAGFTALQESMKSNAQRAEDFIGSMDSLNAAIAADKAEIISGADALGTYTKAVDGSTLSIGKNTAELIANTLQNDENIKKILAAADEVKKSGGPILDAPKFISMYVKGDTDAALKYYQDYLTKVQDYNTQITGASVGNIGAVNAQGGITGGLINATSDTQVVSGADLTGQTEGLAAAQAAADGLKAALEEAGASSDMVKSIMAELGIQAEDSAGSLGTLSDQLKQIKEDVDNAFVNQNAIIDASNDFRTLSEGIIESGGAFGYFTEAGSQNMQNLQGAIASTMSATVQLGGTQSEAVAILIQQMVDQGLASADELIAYFANLNLPNVSMDAVKGFVNGSKQMSAGAQTISSGYKQIATGAKAANKQIDSTAQKIRTLKDYASDLATVFERAFEIRFSSGQALDKVSGAFSSIAKATADAREEISALDADIQSLQADQALQQYFLSVAEAYGDTLAAQQIRANLAQIDVDLTKKTAALKKAQDKTNKTLIGTSDAAIANREEILGLVGDYQDYIKALAASGASQDELAAASARARQEFLAQAQQLGYSESELQKYAAGFDDVSVAIANVPRNVTVTANTNPALQALNEYEARLREMGNKNYSGGTVTPPYFGNIARIQELEALVTRYSSYASVMANNRNFSASDQALAAVWRYRQELIGLRGYATGGFTGPGGQYDIAGLVHRGEYVIPKGQVNQMTGKPYFMEQPRTFAQGGYTGQTGPTMVMLSPEDRAILRSAGGSGNIVLYADSRELARSVNDGNRQIVAQGGRP
jgi:TP901 family phage tail tape measure protein